METSALPDKEFEVIVTKMLTELRRRDEPSWEFQQRNTEYKQASNRSHRTEKYKTQLKNTIQGLNHRLEDAEDRVSDLKDRQRTWPNQRSKEKRMKQSEDSLRDFWANIKPRAFALQESQQEGEGRTGNLPGEQCLTHSLPEAAARYPDAKAQPLPNEWNQRAPRGNSEPKLKTGTESQKQQEKNNWSPRQPPKTTTAGFSTETLQPGGTGTGLSRCSKEKPPNKNTQPRTLPHGTEGGFSGQAKPDHHQAGLPERLEGSPSSRTKGCYSVTQ